MLPLSLHQEGVGCESRLFEEGDTSWMLPEEGTGGCERSEGRGTEGWSCEEGCEKGVLPLELCCLLMPLDAS